MEGTRTLLNAKKLQQDYKAQTGISQYFEFYLPEEEPFDLKLKPCVKTLKMLALGCG